MDFLHKIFKLHSICKFNGFKDDVFKLKKIKISDTDFYKNNFANLKYWENMQDCTEEERAYNVDLIKKMMGCKDELNPIIVDVENNVLDGFHSLTALNELKEEYVMAYKEMDECLLKVIHRKLIKNSK